MAKTPYTDPDPKPTTPYGRPSRTRFFPAPKCPKCGSDRTVRVLDKREPKNDGQACGWCLLQGCEACLLWPYTLWVFLFELLMFLFNPKLKDCTCLDCGHLWRAIK